MSIHLVVTCYCIGGLYNCTICHKWDLNKMWFFYFFFSAKNGHSGGDTLFLCKMHQCKVRIMNKNEWFKCIHFIPTFEQRQIIYNCEAALISMNPFLLSTQNQYLTGDWSHGFQCLHSYKSRYIMLLLSCIKDFLFFNSFTQMNLLLPNTVCEHSLTVVTSE